MLTALDARFGRVYRRNAEHLCPGVVADVRIFGSRARGDAGPESDLDLFVLCERETRELRKALIDLAWDVAYELELPYAPSVHVMSREHFERILGLEHLFASDILRQGVRV